MTALNFSAQFAPDVESGKKTQSIRESCRGLLQGDPIQLYTGQRTKACRKLGEAVCRDVTYVGLTARGVTLGDKSRFPADIDEFARLDGFVSYAAMWAWFSKRYKTESFTGYIIRWLPAMRPAFLAIPIPLDTNAPTRPVLRWHGGKYLLADRIMKFFPPHRTYTEAFGGAASVLLQKPRVHAEVYNDLDDQVVNLFRVLQNPEQAERLIELLRLTPFARREFQIAYEVTEDLVEAARRLVMRSFMGFGSNAHSCAARGRRSTGFRSNSNRSGTTPARDWANYPDALPAIIARMSGVVIEHRDALVLMRRHDGPRTLHYVDPPYLQETRRAEHMYRHELSHEDHVELLATLQDLAGMVVLSGYSSDLYDKGLRSWQRIEIPAYADGARKRVEIVWLNPACIAALDRERAGDGMPLFSGPCVASGEAR